MKKIMMLTICIVFSLAIISDSSIAQDTVKKGTKEYIADLSSNDEAVVVAGRGVDC
jgi:hypothetical protein